MKLELPLLLCLVSPCVHAQERVTKERLQEPRRWKVECSSQYNETGAYKAGCHPLASTACGRVIQDNFLSPDEVTRLINFADRAMGSKNPKYMGGPTIADINSGFVRGPAGLSNMYAGENRTQFTEAEYNFYREVVERIKSRTEEEFGLQYLYFTAPTFITRLVGSYKWSPKSMHDEYWHTHVDKNNTQHYDYSGLLYLSEYGKDFTGGLFDFFVSNDPESPSDLTVEPAPGRLFMFTAGRENPHRVRNVLSGQRYVLSFWFTCDESRRFSTFLDGKMHARYERPASISSSSASPRQQKRDNHISNTQSRSRITEL